MPSLRNDGADEVTLSQDEGRLVGAALEPGDAEEWMRLQLVFGLRPEVISMQLEEGKTPQEILSVAEAAGDPQALESRSASGRRRLNRDRCRLERDRVRVVPRGFSSYPERLAALVDAPSVLLVRGNAEVLATRGIAIVGARAATQSARSIARRLGQELAAAGLTIVSGLARGVDAEAHRGALDADGRTVGVLACGPDRIYPSEHRELAEQICKRGAVVSEFPVGSPPRRAHFPLRNRLISGFSDGVVVVEARRRSGSLITVRHALVQGRDVYVVPGAAAGPYAEGSNRLLRDGARAVLSASDLLEDLGLPIDGSAADGARRFRTGEAAPSRPKFEGSAGIILSLLDDGPLTQDALSTRSGLGPGDLARALLELEIANRIEFDRDGRFHRKWR